MRNLVERMKERGREQLDEAVKVNTKEWERSHGKWNPTKDPSGWFFGMDQKDPPVDQMVNFSGTWKEAVKKAKTHAKKWGFKTIYVLP